MDNPSEMTVSVLIVGAGVFGASTAYHIKKRWPESRVVLLDADQSRGGATPPGLELELVHELDLAAASTDINKIVRADYSSPFYSRLADEAIEAWQTWPALKAYYHRTGWVALDEDDSDTAERIRAVFRDKGHNPTSDIPLSELATHWKGLLDETDLAGFKDAYWNPEAGWCEASRAMDSLIAAAVELGVEFVKCRVQKLLYSDQRVVGVELADEWAGASFFYGDKTLLATGAWTSALMADLEDELAFRSNDCIEQQAQAAGSVVTHFKLSPSEMESLADMPVVVYGGNGEVIPPPVENRLLKFTNARTLTHMTATKSGRRQISMPPANRSQLLVPEALQRETEEYMMNRVMPAFTRGKKAEYWRLCWDARTPSQDWLLDRHPKLDGLYLAVGGSFHSYKFLPTIGKYMARVLAGESNGEEMDKAWRWKQTPHSGRGAHEKTRPMRDLSEYL